VTVANILQLGSHSDRHEKDLDINLASNLRLSQLQSNHYNYKYGSNKLSRRTALIQ